MIDLIIIDVALLVACTILLVTNGRLSHCHPAAIYLGFHAVVVTLRCVGLELGAAPFFSGFHRPVEPVTMPEFRRALILADVALIAMTVGCLHGIRRGERRMAARLRRTDGELRYRPLSLPLIKTVGAMAVIVGMWGIYNVGRLPGRSAYDVAGSQDSLLATSLVAITFAWAGIGLLALIYWYGCRWFLMAPMALYLLVAAVQGGLRFRFIIPAILLAQIVIERQGRRWPKPQVALFGVLILLAFFPLKAVGNLIQTGGSFDDIASVTSDEVSKALLGRSPDLVIFDQYAATLSLSDQSGHLYLGRPYLAVVTLPVPRTLWPGKPGLADHVIELSTAARPMSDTGSVTTLWGDGYLNFWYIGIVLLPYLLGYYLTKFYAIARRYPYRSVIRLGYLLVACNLIQVYRDGPMSLPVFVGAYMFPLTALIVLHVLKVPTTTLRSDRVTPSRPPALA